MVSEDIARGAYCSEIIRDVAREKFDVEAAEIKQKKEDLAELIKEKQKELRFLELH